jgi:uncharacterized membrane protein YkvA (DUF1232 family)
MNAKMESRLEKFRTYQYSDTDKLRDSFREKIDSVAPTMEYVRNLILDAKLLYRILTDDEFELDSKAKEDFTAALWYFIESKDSIPDWIPIIGYWDDYKLLRYVKEKHRSEIERYFESTKHFIANYF